MDAEIIIFTKIVLLYSRQEVCTSGYWYDVDEYVNSCDFGFWAPEKWKIEGKHKRWMETLHIHRKRHFF